jgi:hypothetical protein
MPDYFRLGYALSITADWLDRKNQILRKPGEAQRNNRKPASALAMAESRCGIERQSWFKLLISTG